MDKEIEPKYFRCVKSAGSLFIKEGGFYFYADERGLKAYNKYLDEGFEFEEATKKEYEKQRLMEALK